MPCWQVFARKTQWERSRQRVCWFFPERRACQHLGVQQPPCLTPVNPLAAAPASGAGARLPMPFLFGSAHSYFKSGLGLSQGHYRMSSLAFAPIAEKQVQCRALGFLNSCRGRNLSQQSCRGEQGLSEGCAPGGGEWRAGWRRSTLGAPGPWAGSGADEGGRGTGGVGGAGAAQPAAGERALSRLSHAGRERRVAACAQTVPLHCGFGEPRLLRSQRSLGVRCAPLQGRAALLS